MEGRLRASDCEEVRRKGQGLSRPELPSDPSLKSLDRSRRFQGPFFEQPVETVARDLLGACLLSTVGGRLTAGVVVETEAYGGGDDPASHAATRSGVTERNRAMFGDPGRAYVYRSYGVHWCLNVVTGARGRGEAVLVRGLWPVEGLPVMAARRHGREPLGAGPGRLSQALGVDDALYGHDLRHEPLMLVPGWSVGAERVWVSGRVGVSSAADRPLRFYVAGSSGVSKPGARYVGEPLGDLPTLDRNDSA